jgi:hypothetical protein
VPSPTPRSATVPTIGVATATSGRHPPLVGPSPPLVGRVVHEPAVRLDTPEMHRATTTRVSVFATLVATCALSACAPVPREVVTTTHEIDASAGSRIAIASSGGDIEVVSGGDGVIRVEAVREAPTRAEARDLPVMVDVVDGVARVRWEVGSEEGAAVSFRVAVPRDLEVAAETEGGDVTFRGDGSSRRLRLWSAGGDIEVGGHAGVVMARTEGGDIDVDGALAGDSQLETDGGDIQVALREAVELFVSAHTAGGRATNELGLPRRRTGDGDGFEGTIGDGSSGSLHMATDGGDIHLGGGS